MTYRVAVTAGEPAGIGPDLIVQLAQRDWPAELVVYADRTLLEARAKQLNLPLRIRLHQADTAPRPSRAGELCVQHIAMANPTKPGVLDEANGPYVIETLSQACEANLSGHCAAVVTGPVHKGIINEAGIAFSGHTEFFAQQAQCNDVVMMLATEGLRVALVTTHIPLCYVAKAVTSERLENVIHILHRDLVSKFRIREPQILVCGLNPHAGENGHLGHEEQDVIEPCLAKLRAEFGYHLNGPLPADTIFQPKYLQQADAVLAMYHDQGLPVLKYKGFGAAVNITLGLPFIRTSVDHGTALDIAGTGEAHPGSFTLAVEQAIHLAGQMTQQHEQ